MNATSSNEPSTASRATSGRVRVNLFEKVLWSLNSNPEVLLEHMGLLQDRSIPDEKDRPPLEHVRVEMILIPPIGELLTALLAGRFEKSLNASEPS